MNREQAKSIIVLPADHAAWLKERKFGIGASDAGAMLGLSKWKSNEALWEEKTGLRTAEDISVSPTSSMAMTPSPIYGHCSPWTTRN